MNLKELHDLVKEHPYRKSNNTHYLKDYRELLYKLSHEFYLEVTKTKFKFADNLTHDFNGAISNLSREWKYSAENDFHVEYCIGVIHKFINTGEVLEFKTFYTGCNITIKTIGMSTVYKWNKDDEVFYIFVSKDKLDAVIGEIKEAIFSSEKIAKLKDNREKLCSHYVDYYTRVLESIIKYNKYE